MYYNETQQMNNIHVCHLKLGNYIVMILISLIAAFVAVCHEKTVTYEQGRRIDAHEDC